MTLSLPDAQAIDSAARRLGVDPRVLGGLMELESGVDPNIWGGAGGAYRGLIQFGPDARKEVGLPDRKMTISEQMPYVLRYFEQRGFQPGKHGPTELYRTVLVGNPRQSGTDSFGTNSDKAASRMKPGGDLYERFSKRFDPVMKGGSSMPSAAPPATTSAAPSGLAPVQQAARGGGLVAGLLQSILSDAQNEAGSSDDGSLNIAGALEGALSPFRGRRQAGSSTRMALDPGRFLSPAAETAEQLGPAAQAAGIGGIGALAAQMVQGLFAPKAEARTELPATQATGQMPLGSRGRGGGPGGSIVDAGKALQRVGLRVREHPAFGGVGGHSHGSLHYSGKALDLTDWQDPGESKQSWLPRKIWMGEQLQQLMGKDGEIFHPGNDPKGHPTHIHFGVRSGSLTAEQMASLQNIRKEALKRYPLRWAG